MKHRFPRKLKKKLKKIKLSESLVNGLKSLSRALLNFKPIKFPSGGVINKNEESVL